MPIYVYECYEEDGGCGHQWEIKQKDPVRGACPKCRRLKPVNRNYLLQNVSFFGPNVTLGSLADKNSSIMSDDAKQHLHKEHTKYRDKKFEGSLFPGMEPMGRDSDGNLKISTKQNKKPRKKIKDLNFD